MGKKKRKAQIDAARGLGLDEQMVTNDLNYVSGKRRRILGTVLAVGTVVMLISVLIAFSGAEQSTFAFVTSNTFNVIAAIVGVAFLILQIVTKIKYSHRL